MNVIINGLISIAAVSGAFTGMIGASDQEPWGWPVLAFSAAMLIDSALYRLKD